MTMPRPALAALAATLLAGCVSQGPFPSLAPRPAELEDWSEEPVRAVPVVADDPALSARIAALLGEARTGQRAFEAEAPAAERVAARAGARGSDSWLEAQQAISRLEAARGSTGAAVAELHALDLARASAPTSEADQAALKAAIEEAEAIAARQQQRIDRLSR
ncbi:MAG TPA: hypothetical protein VEW04_02900 [Allosphingosinicella sp.]|nr:hypothetical protein [Allosphingosinicella sp.]